MTDVPRQGLQSGVTFTCWSLDERTLGVCGVRTDGHAVLD